MEQIFCDETGFTGPDLLNPDQKYFGYASVRMEEQEASKLVDRIRAKHPLQMPEWKGSKMLKTRRGREAALTVCEAVRDRSITTVVDNQGLFEEIARWGERMTATSIVTRQVVYLTSEKMFSDGCFHVFKGFGYTETRNLGDDGGEEVFEVELSTWFMDNFVQGTLMLPTAM